MSSKIKDVSGRTYMSEVIDTTKRKKIEDGVSFQDKLTITKRTEEKNSVEEVQCLQEVIE